MESMSGSGKGAGRRRRTQRALLRAGSIAASGGWGLMLGPLLVATLGLLVIAWFLPIMTITKLVFWSDKVSIADAIGQLWSEGDVFIFAVLFLFTIIFPFAKLAAGLWLWARIAPGDARASRIAALIKNLSKWSMLDVFVAALIVVAVKVTVVSDVTIHAGIYAFTAAILLSTLWFGLLERLIARQAAPAETSS